MFSDLLNLANNDGVSEPVRQAVKGALWVIQGKDEQQRISSGKGIIIVLELTTYWQYYNNK